MRFIIASPTTVLKIVLKFNLIGVSGVEED
jgi:hypothetical protein